MISALRNVTVPLGVTCIPHWLGQAKEGKIKASEWRSPFAIYLPSAAIDNLIVNIDQLCNSPNEARIMCLLVDNFCALVACTHILEGQLIAISDGSRFTGEYQKYCDSSKSLFHGYVNNPNHHYALHIERQLRHWGPLIGVSEFAGERLNGIHQSIPTSGQIGKSKWVGSGGLWLNLFFFQGKFGVTIMKSFCQWQRLMEKNEWEVSEQNQESNEVDFKMDYSTYLKILFHLQKKTPKLRDYSKIPHPEGAAVLLNYAQELATIRIRWCLIGNSEPNNMIQYISAAKSIWDEAPWLKDVLDKLEVVHLRQTGIDEVVPSSNVLATGAYRKLLAWTLGCQEPSVLFHVIKKGANWDSTGIFVEDSAL
ncbi:hypothetical protein O181_005977 [Austropuccinia psidii MF-1]|uniref:Uncharacterized protein n=1 Tax=Austropuccinia psidii MF-1 TaxID=1389203 RepID=A0A9Q3BJU2_9BASI|nr:hypothetical protein [Austropuccinia psidii MF-1]